MKIAQVNTPVLRALPASAAASSQPASQQDLAFIGQSQREMGLGKALSSIFYGGVGGVVGGVAGTIAAVQYSPSVLAGVGVAAAGIAGGVAIGATLGYCLYNSNGDWI